MTDSEQLFLCSYCDKAVRFSAEQIGRRGKCPSCNRVVILHPNKDSIIDELLSSCWFYRRMRLIRGLEDVGPISDTEFMSLVNKEHFDADSEVMSPELTKKQWVALGRIKMAAITERIEQREAEIQRRFRYAERRRTVDLENRARLKRGIRSAIESGSISSGQREAIRKFALSAGIPENEVSETISSESLALVREVFDEALADGILEPREEQQIGQLAVALDVELDFDADDQRRISLCRLAYELDAAIFQPPEFATTPFKIAAKETVLAQSKVAWYEVVTLRRPAGIPLGGDNYLKLIGEGDGFLTTKQVSMVGSLQSKKFAISSVQRVTRHTDGVLFNRATGKSVFLQLNMRSEEGSRFALIAEHACSGEPVLGFEPTASFIPEVIEAQVVSSPSNQSPPVRSTASEPRYTFRVVGDHVGNRADLIRALNPGAPLRLVREPENPHDSNAVAVYDQSNRQVGYLKREVAIWFSPILYRKGDVAASVHTFTSAGSLIVAVFL